MAYNRSARVGTTGAHTTDPIKEFAEVKKWLRIAEEHDRTRKRGGVSWYALLLLGFNTSLRIGDICRLKVGDVRNQPRLRVTAEKTNKMTNLPFPADVQKKITEITQGKDDEEYVLSSRQRDARTGVSRPISRQRAYKIIREIAARAGFEGHAGCHTMRKTFAYELYQSSGDLSTVQKALNHSSQTETLVYIGLDQKALDDAVMGMRRMI